MRGKERGSEGKERGSEGKERGSEEGDGGKEGGREGEMGGGERGREGEMEMGRWWKNSDWLMAITVLLATWNLIYATLSAGHKIQRFYYFQCLGLAAVKEAITSVLIL